MKKHLPTIIVVVIFICGLSLFLYPTISNLYNEYLNHKRIGDYQESFSEHPPEKLDQELENARTYEEHRHDPDALHELGLTYENVLNLSDNGMMGYVEIPKISVSLAIYHTIEEEVLQNGIGHVEGSSLPIGGKSSHCVLAGHTGLPSAKLLTNMDQLKAGDSIFIHVLDEVLEYRVDDVSVVEPHEVDRLNVITGKDYLTLVTCTPYGVNSHRLLVRGERVQSGEILHSDELPLQNDLINIEMKYLLTFSLVGLLILALATFKIISMRKNKKKAKTETENKNHDQESI